MTNKLNDLSPSNSAINLQSLTTKRNYDGSIVRSEIEEAVDDILLQSIKPLMDILQIHITDYIIKLRRQLLSNDEFNTVGRIAKRLDINRLTLYNWIEKKIIHSFKIDNKTVVSYSECLAAKQTVYRKRIKIDS